MSSLLDIITNAARQAAEHLAGRNLLLARGGRVHAVGTVEWLGDVPVPGPACRIGTATGPLVGGIATADPVTCHRCLGSNSAVVGQPHLNGLDALMGAASPEPGRAA